MGSYEVIGYDVTGKVIRFDDYKSNPKGRITLIISLMSKYMEIDFLLMNYNAPYNGISDQDWIVPIVVTTSTGFQCIKFLNQG